MTEKGCKRRGGGGGGEGVRGGGGRKGERERDANKSGFDRFTTHVLTNYSSQFVYSPIVYYFKIFFHFIYSHMNESHLTGNIRVTMQLDFAKSIFFFFFFFFMKSIFKNYSGKGNIIIILAILLLS